MLSIVSRTARRVAPRTVRMQVAAMGTNLGALKTKDGIEYFRIDAAAKNLPRRQGMIRTFAKAFQDEPVTLAMMKDKEAVSWAWGTMARSFLAEVAFTGKGIVAMQGDKAVGGLMARDLANPLPDNMYLLAKYWHDPKFQLPKSVEHMRLMGPYMELVGKIDRMFLKEFLPDGLTKHTVLNVSIAAVAPEARGQDVLPNMMELLGDYAKQRWSYRALIVNAPHQGIVKAGAKMGFTPAVTLKYADFKDSQGKAVDTKEDSASVLVKML